MKRAAAALGLGVALTGCTAEDVGPEARGPDAGSAGPVDSVGELRGLVAEHLGVQL